MLSYGRIISNFECFPDDSIPYLPPFNEISVLAHILLHCTKIMVQFQGTAFFCISTEKCFMMFVKFRKNRRIKSQLQVFLIFLEGRLSTVGGFVVLGHLVYIYVCSQCSKKNVVTYVLLNYFFWLVLPVLCMRISCFNFGCLCFRATPCMFNIGELIIGMKHLK